MNTTRVRIWMAIAVTVVWMASYTLSIVNHHYHPPAEINAVMLLVGGFFFASGIREQASELANKEREDIRHVVEEEIRHQREIADGDSA